MLCMIPTLAFAADTGNSTKTIEPKAGSIFWDLNDGSYTASFVGVQSYVDTRAYFKPDSAGRLKVTVNSWWKYHEDSGFNPGLYIDIKTQSGSTIEYRKPYTSTTGNKTFTATGLNANTNYFVTIRLKNSNGSGANTISGNITVSHP